MIKKTYNQSYGIKAVLTFCLFGIFAFCMITTVLFGANIYKNITDNSKESFSKISALSYISTKIRNNDRENAIRMDNIDNVSAIVISETIDNEEYETWIYHYNNAIYELYSIKNLEIKPKDGTKIIDIDEFMIKKDGNLIIIKAKDKFGVSAQIKMSLRSL